MILNTASIRSSLQWARRSVIAVSVTSPGAFHRPDVHVKVRVVVIHEPLRGLMPLRPQCRVAVTQTVLGIGDDGERGVQRIAGCGERSFGFQCPHHPRRGALASALGHSIQMHIRHLVDSATAIWATPAVVVVIAHISLSCSLVVVSARRGSRRDALLLVDGETRVGEGAPAMGRTRYPPNHWPLIRHLPERGSCRRATGVSRNSRTAQTPPGLREWARA